MLSSGNMVIYDKEQVVGGGVNLQEGKSKRKE